MHVLDLYREVEFRPGISVDLLYLDADLSPSWKWLRKLKPDYAGGCREVRLYDYDHSDVRYSIDMNIGPPLPYEALTSGSSFTAGVGALARTKSIFPSWSLPAMPSMSSATQSSEAGTCLGRSPLFHGRSDLADVAPQLRGAHMFPPFARDRSVGGVTFGSQIHCNGLHRIIRGALGIVSKPGAGTLIDSFGSATPIIMLEPFGPHEERNAAGVATPAGSASHTTSGPTLGTPHRCWRNCTSI